MHVWCGYAIKQQNDFLTFLEKEFNKEEECAIKWFS